MLPTKEGSKTELCLIHLGQPKNFGLLCFPWCGHNFACGRSSSRFVHLHFDVFPSCLQAYKEGESPIKNMLRHSVVRKVPICFCSISHTCSNFNFSLLILPLSFVRLISVPHFSMEEEVAYCFSQLLLLVDFINIGNFTRLTLILISDSLQNSSSSQGQPWIIERERCAKL